jgi:HxlR-like helix-turn-helix
VPGNRSLTERRERVLRTLNGVAGSRGHDGDENALAAEVTPLARDASARRELPILIWRRLGVAKADDESASFVASTGRHTPRLHLPPGGRDPPPRKDRRQRTGPLEKGPHLDATELEQTGLVAHHVYAEIPVRVEYALTPLGWRVTELLMALYEWGVANEDELEACRQASAPSA